METQGDGRVMIENGKKFPGPVELLEYHRTHRDGLLTYPTIPCTRAPNESYVVFRGVSSADLEHILLEKAREMGIQVCVLRSLTFKNVFVLVIRSFIVLKDSMPRLTFTQMLKCTLFGVAGTKDLL